MTISSKRVYLRPAMGFAISAVLLYLAFRQVHWRAAFSAIAHCDVGLVLFGLFFALLTYGFFALRWRVLLASVDTLPVSTAFSYVMIGYLANTVLPLRLGDVSRAVLLGRKRQISGSLVLGSIVLERLLDISVILVFALGLSLLIGFVPLIRYGMLIFTATALAVLTGLLFLTHYEERLSVLTLHLPRGIPHQPLAAFIGWIARFAQGSRALRDYRQLAAAIGLSLLAWISAGLWSIFYVHAFHLPAPWYAGLFVVVVVNLGAAIPSSPGAIGVYHSLAMLALSVWVADKNATAAYALVTHALNMALIIILGTLCLWREGWSLSGMSYERDKLHERVE